MIFSRHLLVIALAGLGLMSGCAHQAAGDGHVSRSAISADAQAEATQRRTIGPRLYELVYSPKQRAVYAVSAGGADLAGEPSRVYKLDPDTLAVLARIPLQRRGFGLALDDAADRLYIGNATDASITVVDLHAQREIGIVQLAEKARNAEGKERYPHSFRELVVDTERNRLYAPGLSIQDSALYVVDTANLKLEKIVPGLAGGATGVTLDAKSGKLYVSNLQGQLYTVDAATLKIERKAEVRADQMLNLAYDARSHRVLATDQGSERLEEMRKTLPSMKHYRQRGSGNQVVALNPDNGGLLASIPTGKGPIALLLDSQRGRLYVTNRESGTVTVFDSNDYRLLRTVSLPSHPNSLALNPQTGTVYVTVKNGKQDPQGSDESVAAIRP